MAISDQGERVDSYQVLDGTRPEVVVMMAVDSGLLFVSSFGILR